VRKTTDDNEFEQRIGVLIRDARLAIGIDQTELARRAGTGQGAVSEVERGVNGVTLWYLRRIVNALGFDLKITFERKNYETT
jgi:transcriptional regulator with XRE-family HTH domain